MFDATHRFVMAGHIVSVDFTKQGWRQFAAVNRRLAARYIRAFILKRELQQYIAAHEAAGVHLDTQCQEVCYDSGIYLLLRRTQGTWYITDIVLMDAAAGFVPVFTWERVRRGVSGALRRVPLCRQNPAARPSGGEAVCLCTGKTARSLPSVTVAGSVSDAPCTWTDACAGSASCWTTESR